jgi:hypothetical protein
MNLLLIALLLAQRLPPVRSTGGGGGGGTLDPTTWTGPLTQPALPTAPNPGDSFMSAFGRQVIRITSPATNGGEWFKCNYVDRSCLNLDSTLLMAYTGGGAWRVIPLNANGTPVNNGYPLGDTPGFPGALAVGFWSTTNANRYWVSQGKKLYRFNAAATASASSWTLIKDFDGAWSGNGACSTSATQNVIQGIKPGEDEFYIDNREQSKYTCGAVKYTVSTNTTVWMPGRVYTNTTPTFNPLKLVAVGAAGMTKDGSHILMQANMCSAGDGSTIFQMPNCTGDPNIGEPTTQSFVVPTSSSDWRDGGVSPTGSDPLYHGAMTNRGQVHIANTSLYLGFLPSGSPNYLNGLLWYQDVTTRPLDAQNKIPFVWLGGWANSAGISGIHLSNNTVGSDKYVALSVYNENPPRATGAMANVISLVDTDGRMILAPSNAPNTNVSAVTQQGTIRHLTHHYSYPECLGAGNNYNHQPQASISMDGKWVAFTSSFGECGPGMRHDIFLVKTTP